MNRLAAVLALALALFAASGCVSGGQNRRPSQQTRSTSPLDLNSATAAQLQTLPGITATYARRIIAARPYKVKHELETRKILPPSVYARIRDRVFATERVREPEPSPLLVRTVIGYSLHRFRMQGAPLFEMYSARTRRDFLCLIAMSDKRGRNSKAASQHFAVPFEVAAEKARPYKA